jgi:diguanylate cyclase (GGDEF)-like protein/PAS domain S-box-containing protein
LARDREVDERPLYDLLLHLSARLTSLLADEVDVGVDEALALVGHATGSDRVYVIAFDHEAATISNTHEWVAAGVTPERESVQDQPLSWLAPWMDAFAAGEAVSVERLTELPAAAAVLRTELEAQAIRSVLWVPMPGPGLPLGLVGFDAVRRERRWSASQTDLLRAAGNLIAAALARKAAAAERDRASQRLHAIAALVPGAVYQFQVEPDGALRFPYASPGTHDLLGVSPDALRGDGWPAFERVHRDDLASLLTSIERSRVSLSVWQEEFRVRDAAGSERWVRGHATPERIAGGATLWHGVLSDVTEERTLAEALRRSDAIFRRITSSLRDIVVLTDRSLRVSYVSPSVERVLGHPVSSVLGAPITRFLDQAEAASTGPDLASRVAERDGSTLTHRVRHADGSSRYFESLIHVLDDEDGEPGAVFSARDVTERVAEQRRLEREVAFRTALVGLTNDMLGQALDERFYQRVLERIIELVPEAQGGSLVLRDDDGRYRFVAAVGFDLGALAALRLTPAQLGPRSPRVERIHVRDTDGRLAPELLQAFVQAGRLGEIRTTLSVPITAGGAPRGYMNLDNFESDLAFAGDSHDIATALTAQVGIALQRLQLERDLDEQRRRYEHLASFDPLTGLPNRRLFQDRLEQALAQAQRRREQVALLYVDLDDFKEVNDSLGHDVGDALLTVAAERLVASVRAEDTVARLGGDEFAVILLNVASSPDAGLVAAKLCDAMASPFALGGHVVHVGASIGFAVYPLDADAANGLMKAADVAMYRVKQGGKGGYAP